MEIDVCPVEVDLTVQQERFEELLATAIDIINEYAQLYGCIHCGLGHAEIHYDHEVNCKVKRFFDKVNQQSKNKVRKL